MSARDIRKKMPAKQSLKYSFSKAFEDPESGAVAFEEESVKKVYTSQNSYEFERVTECEIGTFFKCHICGNMPRKVQYNSTCLHFFCEPCLVNFKNTVNTTKFPAIAANGECCAKSMTNIKDLEGLVSAIHSAIKVACRSENCFKEFPIHQLEAHEADCRTRGFYNRNISISRSRSKEIHKDAADLLEQIGDWVDKHKVGMCDFLFFALEEY